MYKRRGRKRSRSGYGKKRNKVKRTYTVSRGGIRL